MTAPLATTQQDEEPVGGHRRGPVEPAAQPEPLVTTPARRRPWAWAAGVGLAALVVWAVLTWPLALNLDDHQHWVGGLPGKATPGDPTMHVGDHLQNVFVYGVVVENLVVGREPYLDAREGAGGPVPLRTASLNVPWTPVVGLAWLVWPVAGLVVGYNLTLALSSVATAVAAFGLLRRHTRWPLLAAAGGLLYAAAPHRMWQLAGHFNAVMWWAFPLLLWAVEVVFARWRAAHARARVRARAGAAGAAGAGVGAAGGAGVGAAGAGVGPFGRGGWGWPAVGVALVALLVGVSGEFHLALYVVGVLGFVAVWQVVGGLWWGRVPLVPVGVLVGVAAAVAGYALLVFRHVFHGDIAGSDRTWQEVMKWSVGPGGLLREVTDGTAGGEGLVYAGWVVVGLALVGLGLVLVGWRREVRALPYALLLPLVGFFTFGPHLAVGGLRPYRWLFDRVGYLADIRVPQRLMVVTMLVLLVLAVVAVDRLGRVQGRRLAAPARGIAARGGRGARALTTALPHAAALLTVVATLAILYDYRFAPSRIVSGETDNDVVARLAADGDQTGPILGLPILHKTAPLNSAATYVAVLSHRRAINAYNQTPAPWHDEMVEALSPLNQGEVTGRALDLLRQTGTRQVVVINEPGVFETGRQWQATIDRPIHCRRYIPHRTGSI